MWDPISLFFCSWILNIGMPPARLNVEDVIKANEQHVVIESIQNSVTLREGINEIQN